MKFKLTRFAPTPSGYLHLGNLYSFVLTAALARKHGSEILLRIDDLDQARCKPEYIEDIFDTLYFLGFSWQKGPKDLVEHENSYSQIHRLPFYQKSISYLMDHKWVFACDCSRNKIGRQQVKGGYPGICTKKNLSFFQPNTALRVHHNPQTFISGFGYPDNNFTSGLPEEMKGFIVQKKDRMPSYQLTSFLDDIWFGVDLVVRGIDLYPSTLAQLYLSHLTPQGIPFRQTTFYHHPLILEKKRKMAKSKGSTSIRKMRETGMKATDIFEELGRRLAIPQKVTSLGDLISIFNQPKDLWQINHHLNLSSPQ